MKGLVSGPNFNCAIDVDMFNWDSRLCGNDRKYDIISTSAAANIVKGKSVLFVGDSHVRGLANNFLYTTCGHSVTEPFSKEDMGNHGTKVIEIATGPCAASTISYLAIMFCEMDIIEHVREEYSAIVFNCKYFMLPTPHSFPIFTE